MSDKFDKDPETAHISISTGLVSAAALPNGQLFLLHSDGQIRSLQFSTAKPLEGGVLVQQTVNTPWFQDAQTFNVATPVATPTAPIVKFLTIPPPTSQTRQSLLSVGMINNAAHLFVVDNTNHRVLNFVVKPANNSTPAASATASATPNSVGGGFIGPANNLPSASLEQQYVSANVVNGVKSSAFDARTNQVNLLAGASNSAATNQVAINVSSTTACHPTP
ncbi:hypothetical protein [Dictyobacter kobayashii]|uniref:DUF4394 domain-containing protein n=1 Tax=Dictyobacter kobayashii TaxID=2014872 RepID=A0A402AEF2_9CHLR|nr:hypothetical protein [Dictyobacter kobayashii]GCE17471.1 hypothetical protein KDK_12710 [Dictyobacter kobayashii]